MMDDGEFKAWLLEKDKEKSQLDKKEDSEERTDAHVTLEILNEMIRRKDKKRDVLELQLEEAKEGKVHSSSAEEKLTRIQEEISTLYHAQSACKNLVGWHSLASKMDKKLETNAPQKAEFNHLCTVYGKQIEGYNANSFLKACPLYEFGRVKRMYLAFSVNHLDKKKEINQLVDYLNKIQTCPKGNNLDRYIREFQEAQRKLRDSFPKDDLINLATIELLEMSSQSVIEQYKAYIDGKLNTLSTLAKEGLKNTEEEATDMHERLESFREAIKCLQVRAPQPEDTAGAFGNFLGVLATDQKTENPTKKIICEHFEDIVKKFMTEDLVCLKDITSLEKDLQVKLMGKPPMSPKVKAAMGVLLGVLAGAIIALTGGIAAVPVAVIGGATTGGTLGTAGFFHGKKKSTEYKEGYGRKVEPLRSAMDGLSKGVTRATGSS